MIKCNDQDIIDFNKSLETHHGEICLVSVDPFQKRIAVESTKELNTGLVAYLFALMAEDPQDVWDFTRALSEFTVEHQRRRANGHWTSIVFISSVEVTP